MLSDPLSVTYDGSAKTLPRVAGQPVIRGTVIANSRFATADGEFSCTITQEVLRDKASRVSIFLERTTPDPDGPFAGSNAILPNRVGLVFDVNEYRYAASVDVARLRTALLALVDTTLQGRLIGGEF